jgi:hypothetical protein
MYDKSIRKLQACHNFLTTMAKRKDNPRHIKNFERLRERNPKEGEDDPQLIKVAIIDNGADKFRQRIRDCIERGVSYVKADTSPPTAPPPSAYSRGGWSRTRTAR